MSLAFALLCFVIPLVADILYGVAAEYAFATVES